MFSYWGNGLDRISGFLVLVCASCPPRSDPLLYLHGLVLSQILGKTEQGSKFSTLQHNKSFFLCFVDYFKYLVICNSGVLTDVISCLVHLV